MKTTPSDMSRKRHGDSREGPEVEKECLCISTHVLSIRVLEFRFLASCEIDFSLEKADSVVERKRTYRTCQLFLEINTSILTSFGHGDRLTRLLAVAFEVFVGL